ncbi:TPA: hypothetical protein ACH3X1_006091 [Trebouxia sp. C0004]
MDVRLNTVASKGTTNKLYYGAADAAPQGVYLTIEDMLTEVNIKRVLGVSFAHSTADLVRGHPALVKPGREEVIAEYPGQQHLLLHDVQIQG